MVKLGRWALGGVLGLMLVWPVFAQPAGPDTVRGDAMQWGRTASTGLNKPQTFAAPLVPGTPTDLEAQALQGGVFFGYNDYSNGLFDMPQTFEQFQRDVNSNLAQQLMVYNIGFPQLAALFGQLNTFGAERFQQYQASIGSSLTEQQKDAHAQYMRQCVPEMRRGLPAAGSDEALAARNTAQAFELCLQRYTAQVRDLQRTSNQTYATLLREAQDVNKMIKPLLCPALATDTCWPNLLIPQVRLCEAGKLGADGKPEVCNANTFGVKPAPVPLNALVDTLKLGLGSDLVQKSVNPFLRGIAVVDGATLRESARIATNQMNVPEPNLAAPSAAIEQFQTQFLNCRDPNLLRGLQKLGGVVYEKAFANDPNNNKTIPGGTGTIGGARQASLNPGPFMAGPLISRTRVLVPPQPNTTIDDQNVVALAQALQVAAGCATNRDLPFLDPELLIAVRNQCSAADVQGYLSLSAMDVAIAASRNLLLYTQSQLEQVLSRLAVDGQTAALGFTVPTTMDGPVIRKRLSDAIKIEMLPRVKSDLMRLDTMEAKKGTLSQKVQEIYQNKGGCLARAAATDRR